MAYNVGITYQKEIFDRSIVTNDDSGARVVKGACDRDNDLPSNSRRDPHYSLP